MFFFSKQCCKSFLVLCAIALPIWPTAASAQADGAASSLNEDSLYAAILALPIEQTAQATNLLKKNPQAATARLWQRLTQQSNHDNMEAHFARSIFILTAARQVAAQLGDKQLEAQTLYSRGSVYTNQLEIDSAIKDYLKCKELLIALNSTERLINALANLGELYLYTDDYYHAKEAAEQCLALSARLTQAQQSKPLRPDAVAVALTTLGAVAKWEGNYQRALDYLQQALSTYQNLAKQNLASAKDIADVQSEIGKVYRTIGDYTQALYHFNQAIDAGRTMHDDVFLGDVMNSLGLLYLEQRDYQKAAALFNQSMEIHVAAKDDLQIGLELLNLGITEQRQANYDKALKYFRDSYAKFEVLKHLDGLIAAGAGIGNTLRQQGNSVAALEWLNKSEALAEEAKGQTRITEILWQKAEAYLAVGNYSASIDSAQKALQLAQQNRFPNLSYLSATVLGRAYLAQKDLTRAAESLSIAIKQIEESRDYVAGTEEESLLFFGDKVEAYHKMVEVLIAQNSLSEALSFAEKAKGRVLLDVMRDGKADVTSAMSATEKEEAQRLNRSISEINEHIRNERAKSVADSTLLNQLYVQLDAARLNYESFQDALYASHPALKLRRGKTTALTLDGTDLVLDNRSAYLEYVLTGDQANLFVITKKDTDTEPQIKLYPIKVKAEDLSRKVNQFRQMMSDRNPVFAGAARELYDLFIKPAAAQLDGIQTLCIIPDGPLWDLPFQALESADHRFLLEDYSIYYAPSLSILRETIRHKGASLKPNVNSVIAFGNPMIGKDMAISNQANNVDDLLCPLPEAETEVNALTRIYGSAQSKVLIGHEASEKAFKAQVSNYKIIHLATHGILDNRHPLYSYLMLMKSEGNDDGLLEAREIMEMNLHADLAVLSSCETARGKVGAGEGVIGMSWAFFIAGVHTTVVSQWRVNSASTSQLMMKFHQALISNQNGGAGKKAGALRMAALSLMKDSRYRHPFYWASFVMVGSNE